MRGRAVGHHQWSLELHRKLLADGHRNRAFQQAISKVARGAVVADIGAGTGFLSFLALQSHAQRCHLYEADVEVSKLSQRIAQESGLPRSRLTCTHHYARRSIDVVQFIRSFRIKRRGPLNATCFVADMNDARRFLKNEQSQLIPCKLRQFVCPVVSREYDDKINSWDDVGVEFRLNLHAAKAIACHSPYQLTIKPEHLLPKGTQVWDELDFYAENPPIRSRRILSWSNLLKPVWGFCVWWEAELVPGVTLGTSPEEHPTHWEQCYLPLVRPLILESSHILRLQIGTEHFPGRGTSLRWQAQLRHGPGGR